MASVTFAVDKSLKLELEKFSWVNWSNVLREESIKREKLQEQYERFSKIVSKSKFTKKDAEEMSAKVKAAMHKHLVDKGLI